MKIAVLVSGGVDSAYSLAKLKFDGHDVTAFYIKIWNPQYELEDQSQCPWKEDVDYVQKLCNQLNVPLKIVNLQNEYQFTVMEYMIDELKKGRTPNPDVMCNSYIKFGAFFDHISFDEYDYVASGHYATNYAQRIAWHYSDPLKDQSFFLSKLTKEQMGKIIFPCSGMSKLQIRHFAKEWNLPQKDRKDSQGLCFIGNVNYSEFVSKYIPNKEGNIYNVEDGTFLGKHNGLHLYTEGQRHGLELPNGPWYVFEKNVEDNSIKVINRLSFHKFTTDEIYYEKMNLIEELSEGHVYLKIRHPQKELIRATLSKRILSDGKVINFFRADGNYHPWNFSSGQIIAIYQKIENGLYPMIGNATILK